MRFFKVVRDPQFNPIWEYIAQERVRIMKSIKWINCWLLQNVLTTEELVDNFKASPYEISCFYIEHSFKIASKNSKGKFPHKRYTVIKIWTTLSQCVLITLCCFNKSKNSNKNNLGKKGFIYLILPGHSSPLREVRAGTQGRNQKGGLLDSPQNIACDKETHS